jgi:hypothetical protein
MTVYLDQNKWIELAREEVERSILTGNERLGMTPPAFRGMAHRENFRNHLSTLRARCQDIPKELRDNWLYAMSTIDILNPINDVMAKHGLEKSAIEALGEQQLKQLLEDMPTRRPDLHLHRQVLRNPQYAPGRAER